MSAPPLLVSNKSPVLSLILILLVVALGFVIVGPTIGLVVSSLFYEVDLVKELQKQSIDPELMPAILVTQGITTLVGLIIFPLIFLRYMEQKPLQPFFPAQPRIFSVLILVAFAGLTFPITISPLVEWNADLNFPEFMSGFENWARQEEDRLAEFTKAATSFNSPGDLLFGLLVIAIIPAIGEELVFRGLIQNELWRGTGNVHTAIWVSAFLFSAIHLQFYGFIPRLLLGALFGYLYYWSGNLLLPVFAHFMNNGLGVVIYYLNRKDIETFDLESSQSAPAPLVIVSSIITAALLYSVFQFYKKYRLASHTDPDSAL